MATALAAPARTPRELAWQFTDREGHFLSHYRILRAYDLIASPAFGAVARVTNRRCACGYVSWRMRGRGSGTFRSGCCCVEKGGA